jgi:hypothetical protein
MVEHGSSSLTWRQVQGHLRVTVGQLSVFDTALIVATAKFDDHVYVVRGDVVAAHIAELIAFGVEWADYGFLHRCPHCASILVVPCQIRLLATSFPLS